MLTAEIIFNYVWLHFCSLYPEAKKLRVDYGSAQNGNVIIPAKGLTFFEKNLPFPEAICWQKWDDQNVPILFQTELTEAISEAGQIVTINADIIAGAFYFLSGWQEIHAKERDRFGRFPYKASLQFQHNFVAVPIVNYYFDILRTALEKGYDISLRNSQNQFATFLSHDVDRLESAWKVEGLRQLKKGNLLQIPKLGWQKLRGADHWHNLKTVAKTVKKLGGISTFFWLAQKGKYQNHPNADYNISESKYQQLIKFLEDEGFENAVHGSFGSSENAAQLKNEAAKINAKVSGNRFHYLCFDPEKTPQNLAQAGINYDSTLGFAEHFGFRNAYCFPFRPFDFSSLKPYPFLEVPLNLMDATLWHPNYLQIPPEKVAETIKPMLLEIKKFGGVLGLLWHNENFSELNTKNGLRAFENIMHELLQLETQFKTGAQLYHDFSKKL
ncbi:polysaccharide deacetylase family protein [Adhaeribacter sp. BT258]|uniref:Polysaccharide deacetylase family protein n=1 Tax=Adhaeribacter terrigena TaxID=2793070 RepID=A0ABS1C305_9BACT|nr:polysaccharide deacetylase family protein [Adhaeribacter terrigena]MBK0403783.1 polysaccharide deacetylase family protein [Adhaeribacter terrigena]